MIARLVTSLMVLATVEPQVELTCRPAHAAGDSEDGLTFRTGAGPCPLDPVGRILAQPLEVNRLAEDTISLPANGFDVSDEL